MDKNDPIHGSGKLSWRSIPADGSRTCIRSIKGFSTPRTLCGSVSIPVERYVWMFLLWVHRLTLSSYTARFLYITTTVDTCPEPSNADVKDIGSPIVASTSFGSMYDKLGVEPHVYEVSSLAYRGMFLDRKDQTILVSGESGAGKTETVKIVLHHLATLETASLLGDNDDWPTSEMIEHIVESSPVFEAFGNAQTVRNHNSSRFGKMTRLHFGFQTNGMCGLRGSSCQTYLLETNRVVSQAPGERNFHIFYQLLAAPSSDKKELLGEAWEHAQSTDFLFLNAATSTHNDAEMWTQTRRALAFFEWKGDKLKSLCQALACILSLGNIVFVDDPESDGCAASSPEQMSRAAEVLGIPAQTLDHALRHRVIQTAGERVDAKLSPGGAKDALDTLVRKIYDVVFQEILKSVNAETRDKSFEEKDGIINILDIYGFEAFETNRFEQLCINYANEMLHKKYIDDNFKRFKDEYEKEGIELFDFSTVDNADVLELLEGRNGVISMLNEECVIPNGNSVVSLTLCLCVRLELSSLTSVSFVFATLVEQNFVQKLKKDQKGHDRLIAGDLLLRTQFGIRHFAAPVVYEASHFVERNMHKLPSELLHVISKSSNEMIGDFFKSLLVAAVARAGPTVTGPTPTGSTPTGSSPAGSESTGSTSTGRKRTSKKKAVLERFRNDLQDLMESMKDTETRYIRCVKPNENLTPGIVDHYTVMRQLQCAGLVTAIDLSRETYPNKLPLEMVVSRFICLANPMDKMILEEMMPYDKVQYLLSKLYAPLLEVYRNCEFTMPYACGKTKAYFRSGALEMLESLRFKFYCAKATVFQTIARIWIAKRRVRRARIGIPLLQAQVRGVAARKIFNSKQKIALKAQSFARATKAKQEFALMRRAFILVQSRWRFIHFKRRRQQELAASVTLTAFARMVFNRSRFLTIKWVSTRLQAMFRQHFVRIRYEYILESCVAIQSFSRRVLALKNVKERRNYLSMLEANRAAIKIQTLTRRNICYKAAMMRRDAVSKIQSSLKAALEKLRFVKVHNAAIKIQSFFLMAFTRIRYGVTKLATIKIQSFFRMTKVRIYFMTAYMASLKVQSFVRMTFVRNKYASALNGQIQRTLSLDPSEIYTTATNDSRDKETSRNSPKPQYTLPANDPATGILRHWMSGACEKSDSKLTDIAQPQTAAPALKSILGPLQSESSISESVPSVEADSLTSSSTQSMQEKEKEMFPREVNFPTDGGDDKDEIIRQLRLQLQDMKEQESILREEIAAVVDSAKEHEEMVDEEFEDRIQAYEEEVVLLKQSLRECQTEKESFQKEIEVVRQSQAEQLESFQLQAHATQESHKEYIHKVSAVLDQVNEARQRETKRILDELDSLKATKVQEIARLRAEIEVLKATKIGPGRGTLMSGKAGIHKDKDKSEEPRRLRKAIMGAIKPERVASVVERANRRPWAKESFIDEKLSLRVGQYVERLVELAVSPCHCENEE